MIAFEGLTLTALVARNPADPSREPASPGPGLESFGVIFLQEEVAPVGQTEAKLAETAPDLAQVAPSEYPALQQSGKRLAFDVSSGPAAQRTPSDVGNTPITRPTSGEGGAAGVTRIAPMAVAPLDVVSQAQSTKAAEFVKPDASPAPSAGASVRVPIPGVEGTARKESDLARAAEVEGDAPILKGTPSGAVDIPVAEDPARDRPGEAADPMKSTVLGEQRLQAAMRQSVEVRPAGVETGAQAQGPERSITLPAEPARVEPGAIRLPLDLVTVPASRAVGPAPLQTEPVLAPDPKPVVDAALAARSPIVQPVPSSPAPELVNAQAAPDADLSAGSTAQAEIPVAKASVATTTFPEADLPVATARPEIQSRPQSFVLAAFEAPPRLPQPLPAETQGLYDVTRRSETQPTTALVEVKSTSAPPPVIVEPRAIDPRREVVRAEAVLREATSPARDTVPAAAQPAGTAVAIAAAQAQPFVLPADARTDPLAQPDIALTEMPGDPRAAETVARATPAAQAQTVPGQVIAQLAEAARALPDGPIEVSLSPEELGRVKLSMTSSEGVMNVSILAERPETLEMLRRNIELLAQDFRELGFANLNFSFGQGQDRQPSVPPDPIGRDDPVLPVTSIDIGIAATRQTAPISGLDLRL